jgi:hypothetical protein
MTSGVSVDEGQQINREQLHELLTIDEGVTLAESSGFQIDDGVDKRRLEMGSLKGIAK